MTAKEKAKELKNRFYPNEFYVQGKPQNPSHWKTIVACSTAQKAVELILETEIDNGWIEYWTEVHKEIEYLRKRAL